MDLGQLIGGNNAKEGFFSEFKVYWGDIAKEILSRDDWAFHHMSLADWKIMIDMEFKPIIDEKVRIYIKELIKVLVESLMTKQDNEKEVEIK